MHKLLKLEGNRLKEKWSMFHNSRMKHMITNEIQNSLNRFVVATLAFGSRPRQGGCKVAGLIVDPGVTSHAPGSAKSVREWTLTLPSELPCWELGRVGVPKGFPKLQRAIWGVKSQWLVALFTSMESSWNVDV